MNSPISNYLIKRTISHHKLYHQKRQIDGGFDMTVMAQTLFELLYLMVCQALSEGHTLIILTHHWQSTIILTIKEYINQALEFEFDIDGIFLTIDTLVTDNLALKSYIAQAINELNHAYRHYELSQNTAFNKNDAERELFLQNISAILLNLLRFYYYTKHKTDGSLQTLTKMLDGHCFFNHQGSLDRPIIWQYRQDHECIYLWLNRIYHAELALLSGLYRAYKTPIHQIDVPKMDNGLNNEQQTAVRAIIEHSICLITGGPGTGKTFTIAHAVMALSSGTPLKLALVAPTGKASQRMKESLQNILKDSQLQLPEPMTIHRLLGIGVDGVARHHKERPLAFDLIIVDEASMMGVELASQLINAIKAGSRLVLLGDTHQLFAVEAGSVLSDCCELPIMKNRRVHLTQSRRFDKNSGIGKLASFINTADIKHKNQLIEFINNHQDVDYHYIGEFDKKNIAQFYDKIAKPYLDEHNSDNYFTLTKKSKSRFYLLSEEQKKHHLQLLYDVFNRYRILCASHLGVWGDDAINHHIKNQHQQYLKVPPKVAKYSDWYHGRPIMILKNRYDLGLFNGDIGICLQNGKKANELFVFFYGETIKSFPISMLTGDMLSTAYAMTIHKSQGSEFLAVAVVCHDSNARLLSKELLYTAITRAKEQVALYATPSALSLAVNRPTIRQTGLTLHDGVGRLTDSGT